MIHKSCAVAYWRRINDAQVEAGEPPLASSEAYDFYRSGVSSEDALILKFSAPNNLRLGIWARLSTGRSGQRDRLFNRAGLRAIILGRSGGRWLVWPMHVALDGTKWRRS